MFVEILDEISQEVKVEVEKRYKRPSNNVPFSISLFYALKFWCNKLVFDPNITNYILQGCTNHEIDQLMNCIHQEWKPKLRQKLTLSGLEPYYETSKIYSVVKAIFGQMNLRSGNMEFIVLIAFAFAAIGYFIYNLNQPKQQTNRREEPTQSNPNPPVPSVYTVQTPPIQTTPVQIITKKFLVLVVSALQADFIKSLAAKRRINSNEGESLYEITKYLCLWLGAETDFNQKKADINQYYKVPKGEESEEYDIYLVYLELNQADEGFKPNVNQLDRYDAFRNLADLEIEFEISPRLQMEAYENFEVYNR